MLLSLAVSRPGDARLPGRRLSWYVFTKREGSTSHGFLLVGFIFLIKTFDSAAFTIENREQHYVENVTSSNKVSRVYFVLGLGKWWNRRPGAEETENGRWHC